MAARRVQFPKAVSQIPLPGLTSTASEGLLTVKTAAWAEAERKTPRSVIPRARFQALFFLNC